MDKKEAIRILIKNNLRLDQKDKESLLSGVDDLSPEALDAFGKALAINNKNDRESLDKQIDFSEEVLNSLDK